ncbi:hypothetical protein GCM10009122_41340 [Fulvivirga kasyanovii]|uniref:DUF695 domain-containing protein n=1 Tax=Fulvivirga kasyanovii TaxID=396812 RepID=A0ABW9RTH6_9BACT|nr:DUF695 domain-containing protein [Fulvivirga kasyanovii]MTI27467.1 DUF695 domain-containing protein [Fulvivirga kasyanovii]
MKALKNLFRKKEKPTISYQDFWYWFEINEERFYNVLQQGKNIEKGFFKELSSKLGELKDGYYFLAGMYNDHTAELILTADGDVSNIIFVEELVDTAPEISRWKFTALKPAMDIKDVNIEMADIKFNTGNINFYANESPDYPDEINITIVHDDFREDNRDIIANGVYIFLDNYLGELNFVTSIDKLDFATQQNIKGELVPVDKLKDYLNWRQKEFIEKYEGTRYNTEKDSYSAMEGRRENGNPVLAIINADLLRWENKASHRWILNIVMSFKAENNGMPDADTYDLLNEIEEEVMGELKDFDGYLNLGRQTAEGQRDIFFACKDFRKPSKVLPQIQTKYGNELGIDFTIFKDKYWQVMEGYR